MLQDLRYAVRILWQQPGFTLVAIITLAIGIGANTAIFSVVNSILLRPLPYKEPSRLVQIWETWPPGSSYTGSVSPNNFFDWRHQAKSFEDLTVYWTWLFTLTGTNEPTEVPGSKVSPNFFALLGVTPELGRTFLPDEDRGEKQHVVVISHGFWQRHFGGRVDVIGQTLKLDDDTFHIVGVLGPDFRETEMVGEHSYSELWVPLPINPGTNMRRSHYLKAIGRLKAGVTLTQARAEMTSIARQLEEAYPDTNRDRGVNLVPLHEQITGNIRRALLVLQFATVFVLLIACSNVANLLLARIAAREKEMAIRGALGASRWQLVRLLLTESLTLAIISGTAGLLLAWCGVTLLVWTAPVSIPRLDEIGLDGRVIVFTLATSLLTVLIFGLLPAWQSARTNLNETLKASGRNVSRGPGLRGILVVAEIALMLVLLVGSGLLLRSLFRMQHVDLGFNHQDLLTMRVSLLESKYRDAGQVTNFYQQLLARIEKIPGVASAGLTSSPPMIKLNNMSTGFEIEGQPLDPGRAPVARFGVVSPDYFTAMSIALIGGRTFNDYDTRENAPVVIINDNFARRNFPNGDAIGKKVTVGRTKREIVGVVRNIKHDSPTDEEEQRIYAPHAQASFGTVMLVIRATTDPNKLVSAASQAVWEGDPDAAVSTVATMDQVLSDAISRPRFNAVLLGIFSVIALLLGTVGIYGVISYIVSQSTREIGIRIALGAQLKDVLKLVLSQGLKLTIVGIGLGIVGALALVRLIKSLLFGVTAHDPVTFISVSAVLFAVAVIACLIPARRATRVDPLVALRYE